MEQSNGTKWYAQLNRYLSVAAVVAALAVNAGVVITRVEVVRGDVARIADKMDAVRLELARREVRLAEIERRLGRLEDR